MVRRAVAVGVLAVGLSAWGLPARAAVAVVSDVRLAWAGESVLVSWNEDAPTANTVQLSTGKVLGSTTEGGADELLVPREEIGSSADPEERVSITVGGAGVGSASSVEFDRYVPAVTNVQMTAVPEGQASWQAYPTPASGTDDPLDVAQGTRYVVDVVEQGPGGSCTVIPMGSREYASGQLAPRSRPFQVRVQARNEWGAGSVGYGSVGVFGLTLTAPASTAYGAALTLSGSQTINKLTGNVAAGQCQITTSSAISTGVLHGRNSSTSPWYVIGSGTSDALGAYKFTVKNPGAREYRLWTSTRQDTYDTFVYGTSTAPRQVRATTSVVSAKFITPAISYGSRPQAYLWVDPAGSQRAALQFVDTDGTWKGLAYKTLSSGRGLLDFPWSRRGTTKFRWWVPGSATGTGLAVDAVYSPVFTLTVS